MLVPVVARDARFKAGRSLVTSGRCAEATGVFVGLLDLSRETYQADSVECVACYYEYGNALFRSLSEGGEEEEEEQASSSDKKEEDESRKRKAAAGAAERRMTEGSTTSSTYTKAPPTKDESNQQEENKKPGDGEDGKEGSGEEKTEEKNEEESDLELSLEMMETAWSILDRHLSSPPAKYLEWGTEQFPRYLTGIGDVLSAMGRHADAADAYSRAVQHRQAQWQAMLSNAAAGSDHDTKAGATPPATLEQLVCRRQIVETLVLMAEQFLACPTDQDVVTSETKSLLCKVGESVEYARGYYDKARDELQEVVFLMGKLVAANPTLDIDAEKENICFASTLLMGVGVQLAQADEEAEAAAADCKQPAKKKAREEK